MTKLNLTLLATAAAAALGATSIAAHAQDYPQQPPPDQPNTYVETPQSIRPDYRNPPQTQQDVQDQDEQQERDQQQQDDQVQAQQQYDQGQQQYQQGQADYQAQQGAYADANADYRARQGAYENQRLAYEDARRRYEHARAVYDARWGAGAYERIHGYGPDPYYYVRVERDPRYWDGRWHDHPRDWYRERNLPY